MRWVHAADGKRCGFHCQGLRSSAALSLPSMRNGTDSVLVRDLPLAIDLAETECAAEPEVLLLAALRSGKMIEAVTEGDTIAADDFEVAQFVTERTVPGLEPFLQSGRGRSRRQREAGRAKSELGPWRRGA